MPTEAKKVVARRPKAATGDAPIARPTRQRARSFAPPRQSLESRLAAVDWTRALEDLRSHGIFLAPGLLAAQECDELATAFAEDSRFERTIQMGPRGYGIGTYRYWKEPIPEPARTLRAELYRRLRTLATEEHGASEYPPRLDEFWRSCRANGQGRASSLVLKYPEGGVNFPHRDIYGRIWFPYQAVCVLSRRGADFEGGEFTLHEEVSEEAPRERLFALDAGDLAVFASRGYRSEKNARMRFVEVRHGMRTVTRGERYALGLVLHLAE